MGVERPVASGVLVTLLSKSTVCGGGFSRFYPPAPGIIQGTGYLEDILGHSINFPSSGRSRDASADE